MTKEHRPSPEKSLALVNVSGDAETTAIAPAQNDGRVLTRSEFFGLAELPPENEWFAGITNPHTRRAYKADIADFMGFTGIKRPEEFRIVTRGHVLAWRKGIEERELSGATIRRKMAALSSLFEYLSEKNAVINKVLSQSLVVRAKSKNWAP